MAQGKIYVVTALIENLTVLLEYIDLFGAHKQSEAQKQSAWGPGQNASVAPPLDGP